MTKKNKIIISICLLVALFFSIFGSSLAYFSDSIMQQLDGTTGTVDVSLDDSGINLLNDFGQDILNPGDARPVVFTVTNDGNKSVDTEVVIKLTSSVPMCDNQRLNFEPISLIVAEEGTPDPMLYEKKVYSSEYELYLKDDVVFVDGYGHYPKEDAKPLQVRYMNTDGTQIAYVLDSEILSGNMSLDEQEKEYKLEGKYLYFTKADYGAYESYISDLGERMVVGTRPLNPDETDLIVLIPDVAEYMDIGNLAKTGAKEICVSNNIKGFTEYDSSWNYVAFTAEEMEEKYGVNITYYDDYNELLSKQFISDAEYAALSSEEQAYYAKYSDTKVYDLVLLFDPNSGNKFQNSSVSIKVEVKAKQHRNTEAGWELVGESTNASIDTSVFTVENNPFGQVELTGVQDGVDLYSLTDIEIPEGVEVIPNQFFQGWENLKTVKLPSTLKVIGDLAFKECRGLTSINLPEGLEFMGNWAFGNCNSLTEIAIPDSVTYVGESTFRYSGVENVTIGSGLTYISNHMFAGAELKSIVIPSTVKEIGDYAFYQCQSLTNIEISEGVTSIGLCAFSECQALTNFTIPSSVTEIGDSAFNGCWGLTTVIIPEGVTRIGDRAFSSCDKLTTVVIPDSVTEIGQNAFWHYSKKAITVYTNKELDISTYFGYRTVTFLPYEEYVG